MNELRDAAAAADFRPAEWLTLVPVAVPPLDGPAGDAEGAPDAGDPAAELRAVRPMTRRSLVAAFRGHVWLHAAAAVCTRLAVPAQFHVPYNVVVAVLDLCLLALAFRFNDGRFGTPQLASGIAAVAVYRIGALAFYAVALLKGSGVAPDAKQFVYASVLGPLARYLELCRDVGGDADKEHAGKGGYTLLEHVDGDEFCPCPRTTCAGRAPRSALLHGVQGVTSNELLYIACNFLVVVTPLVTFGPSLVASWWGMLLVVVYAVQLLFHVFIGFGLFAGQPNTGVASLEMKLQRRAASVALDGLLDRYRAALDGKATLPNPQGQYLYIRLHGHLAALWRLRDSRRNPASFRNFRDSFAVTVPVSILVGVVLTASVGGCVCAWQIGAVVFALHTVVNLGIARPGGAKQGDRRRRLGLPHRAAAHPHPPFRRPPPPAPVRRPPGRCRGRAGRARPRARLLPRGRRRPPHGLLRLPDLVRVRADLCRVVGNAGDRAVDGAQGAWGVFDVGEFLSGSLMSCWGETGGPGVAGGEWSCDAKIPVL